MRTLVLSHQHGLAPLAWRLKREGTSVDFLVWSERYEKAWGGRLAQIASGKPAQKVAALEPIIELAKLGELQVVTDSLRGMELFADAQHRFAIIESKPWQQYPALAMVGWFNGESWVGKRWCVPDWGLWPGGLGPTMMGGVTLIAGEQFPPVMEAFSDSLKSLSFKGLVMVGLDFMQAARELVPTDIVAGWPSLVTTAWMSECTSLSDVLAGGDPHFTPSKFVVALPVSIPPYPVRGAPGAKGISLAGLTTEITKYCYFHDMEVEGSDVRTAGLNGLVAVVCAPGQSMYTAHSRAVGAALALPLPEKQFRPDVGGNVNMTLSALEQLNFM